MPRIGMMLALAAMLIAAPGCRGKASEEQCDEAARHMVSLLYRKVDSDVREKYGSAMLSRQSGHTRTALARECKEKWSGSGVQCVLDAKTKSEVRRCHFW